MSYSELTGTQSMRNFRKIMDKALRGIPLIFNLNYEGQIFEVSIRQKETQGQRLVRLLNQNKQKRDEQLPAVDNQDIYKMYKKLNQEEFRKMTGYIVTNLDKGGSIPETHSENERLFTYK